MSSGASDSTILSVTMTIFVSVEKLGMSSSPALDSISYMLVVVPIG